MLALVPWPYCWKEEWLCCCNALVLVDKHSHQESSSMVYFLLFFNQPCYFLLLFGPCFSGCLFLFLPILSFSLGNFQIKWRIWSWRRIMHFFFRVYVVYPYKCLWLYAYPEEIWVIVVFSLCMCVSYDVLF